MYESALYNLFTGDSALVALLGTYNTKPAVFDQVAPEAAPFMYLVYEISKYGEDSGAVSRFLVDINLFDMNSSREPARNAVERIEYLLKFKTLTHARYSQIRHYTPDILVIDEGDPSCIHYNIRCDAKAVETKWINSITH